MRFLLLLSLLVAAPLSAQSTTKPVSRKDLNGDWTGTLVLDNSSPRITLSIQATDSTLSGVAFADGQRFGPMDSLTFKADTLHFKVDRLDFTGIVKGDKISMSIIVYNGSTRTMTFAKQP